MKPAEVVTVAVAIPLIAAIIAGEVAANRAPAPQPVQRTAQLESGANFDEIVVSAKRTTKG